MRVIETLSESDSGEQREAEKQKLEEQFYQSDQRLDKLVSKHQKDLTQVMQVYAKVNNRLSVSRGKIVAIKTSLNACKVSSYVRYECLLDRFSTLKLAFYH